MMSDVSIGTLMTTGQIARERGVSLALVDYAIRTRRIEPVGRFGISRVFDRRGADQIGEALRAMRSDPRSPARWRKAQSDRTA